MKKALLFIIPIAIIGLAFVVRKSDSLKFRNASANYKEYCASCHGEKLASFVNRKWIYGNSWNEVYKAIKVGYPDDGMPAYDTTFTDKEISDLVDYILTGIENVVIEDFDQDSEDWSGVVESEVQNFRLDTVVTGLKIPWGIGFLPNGDLLITERSGAFYRYGKDKKLRAIKGAPKVLAKGQGGLLDVEIHPEFEKNNWIYLSYSKPDADGTKATTAIYRAVLEGDQLKEGKDIFVAEPYLPTRHHYGSRIEFDSAGYIFFSVGDRGRRDQNPQYLSNHCGKIHRIKDDGSIPEDNPFVNQRKAKPSIYSYGHRNPQGVAIDRGTGQLWAHEHGPRGGDEINRIEPSKNYGWPIISYGINYNGTKFTDLTQQEGMEQPKYYWVPSIGACGMTFVNSEIYPSWKGNLLAGSLRFHYIERVVIENDEVVGTEKLLKNVGRMRDIKMSNDGYIYFAVENPGMIIRILPEG